MNIQGTLDRIGTTATLNIIAQSGDYDPDTGERTKATTAYTIKCKKSGFKTNELIPDRINTGDVRLYFKTDIAVTKTDHIVIGSEKWNFIDILSYEIKGDTIFYVLQARK